MAKTTQYKCITGRELKAGDTVVLTDDEGVDRFFTIPPSRNGRREVEGHTAPYRLGGGRRDDGHYWYKSDDDYVYIIKPIPTTEEKLATILDALHKDSSNPVSRQILQSIGEA